MRDKSNNEYQPGFSSQDGSGNIDFQEFLQVKRFVHFLLKRLFLHRFGPGP